MEDRTLCPKNPNSSILERSKIIKLNMFNISATQIWKDSTSAWMFGRTLMSYSRLLHARVRSCATLHPSIFHTHAWCPSSCSRQLWQVSHIATYTTPDLLLKYPDETFATCVWRKIKHLKHVSETFAKTPKNAWKAIAKHMQHPYKNTCKHVWNIRNIQIKTLATYV
jgi:hypothetical protein